MAKFTVCYRLVCNGAITVEADDEDAASALVAAMDDATLAQSALEDCEREFVSVAEEEP